MIYGRPLLYLSLPGVALILGVFWYRRRNRNRLIESDKKPVEIDSKAEDEHQIEFHSITKKNINTEVIKQPTKSMNISSYALLDEDSCASKLFGKSAPIKIQKGNRSSPINALQPNNIDSNILRSKIEDAEYKNLCSIDENFENLSSPVDLPDSMNHRSSFYAHNVNFNKDQPVVIKATNTPKISPENSFLEKKCAKSSDQKYEVDMKENNIHKKKNKTTSINADLNKEEADDKRNIESASPSLSICSVQSGDSGKGSSLPRSEPARVKTTYEFFYPISLIGYLYGRQRSFVNKIKTKTNAEVTLRRYPFSSKLRVCVIKGTETEINGALEMIRQRLPAKRYPNFTMQRIHYALPQSIVPLSTHSLPNLQLNLIEGINNDVIVSTVLSGNHLFVQHPLHPTHLSLTMLQKFLNDSYTKNDSPLLPCIELNAVCVLQVNGMWYRVQIVDQDLEDKLCCVVRFLDFGGYMSAHFNELRQIRSDFMGLPFQATECILSNIEPIGDCWYPEAAEILCKLTRGIVLQAQVAGYNSYNIPEIYLFACLGPKNVIFINKELVARNLAKWVDMRE